MNTLTGILNNLTEKNIVLRLYKYYILDSIMIVKREGFKSLIKKRGWKIFLIIAGYYAVRDTIIYIIIPLLIAQGVL